SAPPGSAIRLSPSQTRQTPVVSFGSSRRARRASGSTGLVGVTESANLAPLREGTPPPVDTPQVGRQRSSIFLARSARGPSMRIEYLSDYARDQLRPSESDLTAQQLKHQEATEALGAARRAKPWWKRVLFVPAQDEKEKWIQMQGTHGSRCNQPNM